MPHLPTQNHLLAALPAEEFRRLQPHLEPVALPLGWSLYESGDRQSHVYFLTEGIVCRLFVTEDGASTEIAVTGREGLVGISVFMGGASTPGRAVVQSAGYAYRLGGHVVREEFERGGVFQHLLLRFTQALLTQMAQTAVCNRYHSIEQQLCRLLLLSLDRLGSNEVKMTQELIANMLGVRREGVTEAAQRLQDAGLIQYHRGRIAVMDRRGLEQRVCECYAVVKREFDRLLSLKPSADSDQASGWITHKPVVFNPSPVAPAPRSEPSARPAPPPTGSPRPSAPKRGTSKSLSGRTAATQSIPLPPIPRRRRWSSILPEILRLRLHRI